MNAWLVVLTWNGCQETLQLLDSLRAADLTDTTVLVVDNASTDGTLDAIRDQHPWVQTIRNQANLGYAGGNNVGLHFAIDNGAEVIGVINNDTTVAHDFWHPLVDTARDGSTAVSPDIRYADAPDTSWFYGGVISPLGPRHQSAAEQPARTSPSTTELLTGCCLVATTTVWQQVGFFDEDYFLIFEDSDWCLRAGRQGVELVLQPASVIFHKVSRSIDRAGHGIGLYYFTRNGITFARRWMGLAASRRFIVQRVIRDGLGDVRRNGRSGLRSMGIRLAGLVAALTRRKGPAGSIVGALSGTRRADLERQHSY